MLVQHQNGERSDRSGARDASTKCSSRVALLCAVLQSHRHACSSPSVLTPPGGEIPIVEFAPANEEGLGGPSASKPLFSPDHVHQFVNSKVLLTPTFRFTMIRTGDTFACT